MASETGRPFFDMLSININDTLQDNEHIAIENSVYIASDTSLNDTTISGELNVYGNTIMESDLSINGDLFVSGTIQVDLSQNFAAGDNITLTQDGTTKVITIALNTDINSNEDISGDLVVDGDISMNGDLLVGGTIQGDLSQNFAAGDNITLTQDASSKVITIALNTDINSNVDISGDLTLNGNLKGKITSYHISQLGEDISGDSVIDYSGYSVSLSSDGSRVAIGAPKNIFLSNDAGHVKVYEYVDTSWVQLGNDIDGDAIDDYSGRSVSLNSNGTRVAIGAPYNNVSSGRVKVYEWNDPSWVQLGNNIEGEAADDQSGWSVSLNSDGSIVAIGATYNDGSGNYNNGHVCIYEYDTSWVKMGEDIDGDAASDQSGYSVSLSSDGYIVAIGAPFNDGSDETNSGHVKLYQYIDASWVKMGEDIDGEKAGDKSGRSVSLSSDGTRVAIGAIGNDAGHVKIYEIIPQYLLEVDGDISMNGDLVVGGTIQGDLSQNFAAGDNITLTQDGSTKVITIALNTDINSNEDFSGDLFVGGDISMNGDLVVGGTIQGDLSQNFVAGDNITLTQGTSKVITISSSSNLNTDDDISFNSNVDISGDLTLNGKLKGKFTDAYFSQLGQDIDGQVDGDKSGYSVSLNSDGTRVAIGSPWYTGINGTYSGNVKVYEWYENDASWVPLGNALEGKAAGNFSGYSVSLDSSGTRVAIGAPFNNDNGGLSGHVRIYEWNDPSWVQLGDIEGEAGGDHSGRSVSLSSNGTRVAIGSTENDDNGGNSGHVRIYEWYENDASWVKMGEDIYGEVGGDKSGYSVSLNSDGSIVAIGARLNNNETGHVKVYEWDENDASWVKMGEDIDGDAVGDNSGRVSLSSDGKIVAIGAQLNNGSNGNHSGHVKVYKWNETDASWVQLGYDIEGDALSDQSGYSVSLSSDGTIVAIGAPNNDGGGDNSGHVKVYQYVDASWVQLGYDIDGKAAYDESGYSVSLSSDGTRVAIGAPDNDAGHVKVYEIIPPKNPLLEVDGDISMNGDLVVGGDIEIAGNLTLNGEQFIRVVAMAIVNKDGTTDKAVGCKVSLYPDDTFSIYECTFTSPRPTNSYVVNYTPYYMEDSSTLINHVQSFKGYFRYFIHDKDGGGTTGDIIKANHSFTVFDTD